MFVFGHILLQLIVDEFSVVNAMMPSAWEGGSQALGIKALTFIVVVGCRGVVELGGLVLVYSTTNRFGPSECLICPVFDPHCISLHYSNNFIRSRCQKVYNFWTFYYYECKEFSKQKSCLPTGAGLLCTGGGWVVIGGPVIWTSCKFWLVADSYDWYLLLLGCCW